MIAFDFFCGGGGMSKGLENAGIDNWEVMRIMIQVRKSLHL